MTKLFPSLQNVPSRFYYVIFFLPIPLDHFAATLSAESDPRPRRVAP